MIVEMQLGNVHRMKQIDTASRLMVICSWTPIFCEVLDLGADKLVDSERSR